MQFHALTATDSGRRAACSPLAAEPALLRPLALVFALAGSLQADDAACQALVRSVLALPDSVRERREMLAKLLSDSAPAARSQVHVRQLPEGGWFTLAGDISNTAPGLYLLLRDLLSPVDADLWSPGQVADIVRATNDLSPIFDEAGLYPGPPLPSLIMRFSSFLAVAQAHDAYIRLEMVRD